MPASPDNSAQMVDRETQLSTMVGWADVPCTRVTQLAADILDVPVALLSLRRADEYRFRVNIGLDGLESVPCRISFCAYTMLSTDVLAVSDARVDARFRQNPLVLGAPYIVTYVGVPLISARGVTLGTLCAIDHRPREFSSQQFEQLRGVARIAAWLLETESAQKQVLAERERAAIALHEGVAQDLFALQLQLQRLRTTGTVVSGSAIETALDRTIHDVCAIAKELIPQQPADPDAAEVIRLA